MQFTYKATKNGEEYENTVDMPNRFSVYEHIKKEDGVVISVDEKRNIHGLKLSNNIFETVKTKEKIIMPVKKKITSRAARAKKKPVRRKIIKKASVNYFLRPNR